MGHDDDCIPLIDEPLLNGSGGALAGQRPWQILIVDDDEDVHQATEFALRDTEILGRSLCFLHAYDSREALHVLASNPDVAVLLLDVVMETGHAGLEVVGAIRETLGRQSLRIILRTGQPGYAPEIDAVTRYDINDYKTKSELTRSKLFTSLTAAIRCYDQIERLEASRRGLEQVVSATRRFIPEQCGEAFGEGILRQLAELLSVGVSGFVISPVLPLTQSDEDPRYWQLISVAGRFATQMGKTLAEVADANAERAVRLAIGRCRHVYLHDSVTLFLPRGSGTGLVAYLDCRQLPDAISQHLVDVLSANICLCGENMALLSSLRNVAYVDSLTGLPNRAAQIEAIAARLPAVDQGRLSLVLVDIDQFSETIDVLGYRFGDLQLVAVARRLRAALPNDVFVARIGGDVFSVFGCADVVNPGVLREILGQPFAIEGGMQTVSISLGRVDVGDVPTSGADLLRNAAIALKRAKVDGPGNEASYTPEVANETRDRIRLLQDLRGAFDSRSLFVVYQPQFDLGTGKLLGVEALLRWRNEAGEYVPPERFIPVAEQSGLIVALGNWVFRTSLHTRQFLADSGWPLRMAINVSVVQFRHPQFIEMVDEAFQNSGVAPADVELEITESVAMLGWNHLSERLDLLRKRGVRIAIDDFGTGFSSLSYLEQLGADCLKIDRSFVSSMGNSASGARIVEMVIQLGRQLGMRVLAEGVESTGQAAMLKSLGCTEAQGWYYARAMTLDDLLAWLRHRQIS